MILTVGADPEFFCTDGRKYISAIGKIPGSKDAPAKISCGSIQVDNVACEFNTVPATDRDSFSKAVEEPLHYIADLLRAQDLMVAEDACATFEKSELTSPEACWAGCDPDYCAYDGSCNMPPDYSVCDDRSAAGHVHVGCKVNKWDVPALVKGLDLFLTIGGLHLEEPNRRKLYGKAGCFRHKEYGVEYRTPSNFWIFSDARRKWVYDCVKRAVTEYKYTPIPPNLQQVIDTHDVAAAQDMMKTYKIECCPY